MLLVMFLLLLLVVMLMMMMMMMMMFVCRKKQLLSDDRARRITSNDSIKIFSSASDKPENIGRAVLSYSSSSANAQVF